MTSGVYQRTQEHKDSISGALCGRRLTKIHRENVSSALKLRYKDPQNRRQIRKQLICRKVSEETRQKIKKALTGRKMSEQTRKNSSKAHKGVKLSKRHISALKQGQLNSWASGLRTNGLLGSVLSEKHKQSISLTLKKKYRLGEIAFNPMSHRPTSYEQKIIEIIKKHKLPFEYTGDRSCWINGANPDFINADQTKIIEVFCNFFKLKWFETLDAYKDTRRNVFNSQEVLFIDDSLITSPELEQTLVEFSGGVSNG